MIGHHGLQFDWDEGKAFRNRITHKVSFTEALTVFGDPDARLLPDSKHSQDEERWHTIGFSNKGRLLTVVHTYEGDYIRIISAWRATPKERRDYEETC